MDDVAGLRADKPYGRRVKKNVQGGIVYPRAHSLPVAYIVNYICNSTCISINKYDEKTKKNSPSRYRRRRHPKPPPYLQ